MAISVSQVNQTVVCGGCGGSGSAGEAGQMRLKTLWRHQVEVNGSRAAQSLDYQTESGTTTLGLIGHLSTSRFC